MFINFAVAVTLSLEPDVEKLKKAICRVLVSYHADLTGLPDTSLSSLADQLFTASLISAPLKNTPSIDKFIDEFKASLRFLKKVFQVKDHCMKFLKAFIAVGGSYSTAANALCDDWIETVNNEFDISFSIDLD